MNCKYTYSYSINAIVFGGCVVARPGYGVSVTFLADGISWN